MSIPLNPSIKFAPLIMNKKHKMTKIDARKWLLVIDFKKIKSMCRILSWKKYTNKNKIIIIATNLLKGVILILRSSKKPIKNINELKKM